MLIKYTGNVWLHISVNLNKMKSISLSASVARNMLVTSEFIHVVYLQIKSLSKRLHLLAYLTLSASGTFLE